MSLSEKQRLALRSVAESTRPRFWLEAKFGKRTVDSLVERGALTEAEAAASRNDTRFALNEAWAGSLHKRERRREPEVDQLRLV